MPHLTLSLASDGPLVEVAFAASSERIEALKLTGQSYPKPVWATGLIDTGAGISAVGGDVIQALGIVPIGQIDVYSAVVGHVRPCNLYDVCLAFAPRSSPTVMHVDMPIIEGVFSGKRYNALIGRDILRRCLFFYNGSADTFTLAF